MFSGWFLVIVVVGGVVVVIAASGTIIIVIGFLGFLIVWQDLTTTTTPCAFQSHPLPCKKTQ